MALIHGYRTLAETGRILGVSAARVLDMVDNGPLIARQLEDGIYVHDEDLVAFRRPLGVVPQSPIMSEEFPGEAGSPVKPRLTAPLHLAASNGRIVIPATETKSRRSRRGSR